MLTPSTLLLEGLRYPDLNRQMRMLLARCHVARLQSRDWDDSCREKKVSGGISKFVTIPHIVPRLSDDSDGGPPQGTSVVLSGECDPGCLTRLYSWDSLDDEMNRW